MRRSLILLGIYSILIQACSTETKVDQEKDKFQITTPWVIDTSYTIDYVANIRSVNYVELRSRVKGYLERINTDEGKPVKKDQVLFCLSNRGYKEQLLKAKANLKILQSDLRTQELELKNLKNLLEKNVVSKTDIEKAEAKLDAIKAQIEGAEAEVTQAEIDLDRTEIRSPFDGVVTLIPNKVGSLIDDGTLLTTITNNNYVYAYFNVAESEYLDFFSKQDIVNTERVSLVLANNKEHASKGVIETVNGEVESTGNLTIRAQFPNDQSIVKHGSTGKVRVYLPIKNALIIPQKSSFEIQDKNFVYVVNDSGVVSKKAFVPKFRLQSFFIVKSGLDPKDKIVYEGIQYLNEGDKIASEMIPIQSIINKLK